MQRAQRTPAFGSDCIITVMLVAVEGGAAGRLWHRIKQRWFLKAS